MEYYLDYAFIDNVVFSSQTILLPQMNKEVFGKISELFMCSAVTVLSHSGVSVPTGMLETALSAGGLLNHLKRNKQVNLVRVLELFGTEVEKNWSVWGELHDKEEGRAAAASLAFKQVLPFLNAVPKQLVTSNLDSAEIANCFLEQAQNSLPNLYSADDPNCNDARQFLVQLTRSAISHLFDSTEFISMIQPDLWRSTFSRLNSQDRQLRELKALILDQNDKHNNAVQKELKSKLAVLSSRYRNDKQAMLNLLAILLEHEVPVELFDSEIKKAESIAEEMIGEISKNRLTPDSEVRQLEQAATNALSSRDFRTAESCFRRIHSLRKRRNTDIADAEAKAMADIAKTVEASLDYGRAASLYKEAAETVGISSHLVWYYNNLSASLLSDHGKWYGDNDMLLAAIGEFEKTVLPLVPKDIHPHEWSDSALSLGITKATLGERTRDLKALWEAEQIFEECLSLRSHDCQSTEAAAMFSCLGSVLSTIGTAIKNEECLNKSIENFERALVVYDRLQDSYQWAMTKQNMASSILELGVIRRNEQDYIDAKKCFNDALQLISSKNNKKDEALVRKNLADAYRQEYLVLKTNNCLENAIEEAELAIVILDSIYAPIQLAITNTVLADSLFLLAQATNDIILAKRAEKNFKAARNRYRMFRQLEYEKNAVLELKKSQDLINELIDVKL